MQLINIEQYDAKDIGRVGTQKYARRILFPGVNVKPIIIPINL